MAKPIQELFTELQKAFEAAEKDQQALNAANESAKTAIARAKAAYDAEMAKADAAQKAAQAKFGDSSGYVRQLQDEVNAVLGRVDSRVRVG